MCDHTPCDMAIQALHCAQWHDARAAAADPQACDGKRQAHADMAEALRRVAERLAAGWLPGVR